MRRRIRNKETKVEGNIKKGISPNIEENMAKLEDAFMDCPDFIKKKVYIKGSTEAFFLYIKGITNIDLAQRDFVNPILTLKDNDDITKLETFERVIAANFDFHYDLPSVIKEILSGYIVLVIDGNSFALTCKLHKFEHRGVEEPATEKNVRGPHEGFTELFDSNIAILRRKVKNNNLKFKIINLGTTSNQSVAIAYIDDIANKDILNRLVNKIEAINFDGLMAIGYVEQFISDFKYSPFPQYLATERPEKAMAGLLEGRFVVIQEGTPVTLIAPVSFFSFFQALDDFSTNWMFGSWLRAIRLLGALIAIFLPALYIAVTSFHYFMVPLDLLVPLAESRAKVPFPPIVEALILEITLEMLREASIRLPTYIGISIGVVGGLVIGQAAVAAGVVSELFIIIVAVTAIGSFLIPSYDMGLAVRFIRFIFMLLSSIFGIIGIVVSAVMLFAHLVVLESLGQPYFQPLIPLKLRDLKDMVVRAPMKLLSRRSQQGQPQNDKRGR